MSKVIDLALDKIEVERVPVRIGGRVADEVEMEGGKVKVLLNPDIYMKLAWIKAKFGFPSIEDVIIWLMDSCFGLGNSLVQLREQICKQIDGIMDDRSPSTWVYEHWWKDSSAHRD